MLNAISVAVDLPISYQVANVTILVGNRDTKLE